jgi:hypothetical protein
MMKEKVITCVQCENPFVFNIAQQERFVALGFDTPKRCPECRKKKFKDIHLNERWKGKGRNKDTPWSREY